MAIGVEAFPNSLIAKIKPLSPVFSQGFILLARKMSPKATFSERGGDPERSEGRSMLGLTVPTHQKKNLFLGGGGFGGFSEKWPKNVDFGHFSHILPPVRR